MTQHTQISGVEIKRGHAGDVCDSCGIPHHRDDMVRLRFKKHPTDANLCRQCGRDLRARLRKVLP